MTTQLSRPERSRLKELEAQIQAGIQIFFRVGKALLEIQATRLYRETHATWEAYCLDRWGIGKSQAYRLIQAAEVVEDLSPIGGEPPNERQARELVPLDADQRRRVWDEATAGGTQDTTATRLQELTAKALASLPPEEQREAIELSELQILDRGREARQIGGGGARERLAQIERLTRRVRKLVGGLGPEAEGPLALLDRFMVAVAAVEMDAAA